MAALATVTDLESRGIDTSDPTRVSDLLDAASEAIRDAAGSPITVTETTLAMPGPAGSWLTLPVVPVRSVSTVAINGESVTDYTLVGGRLWRSCGWSALDAPSVVTVTVSHGLDAVPADVVDLCCSLVAAGLSAADEGYDPHRSLAYERVDDYQRGFRQGDAEIVGPLDLPDRTRASLRRRFGGGVYVTGSL